MLPALSAQGTRAWRAYILITCEMPLPHSESLFSSSSAISNPHYIPRLQEELLVRMDSKEESILCSKCLVLFTLKVLLASPGLAHGSVLPDEPVNVGTFI